ncbi:MAG TPA: hypothetical protein VFB84_16740 [Micromonosporaceae bacterium]|nr:hypothetical protein [Micromonosporaceae bacterium]
MRLTWKDAAATGLVAVIVALYAGFLTDATLPLLDSPRMLAAVALVLGIGACTVGGTMVPAAKGQPASPGARLFGFFGTMTLIAAVLVMITGSEKLLAVQVGTTVALWLAATLRHLLTPAAAGAPGPMPAGAREREMTRH